MSGPWLLFVWLNYGALVVPAMAFATEAQCAAEARMAETEISEEADRMGYEDWAVVCCRPAKDECEVRQ